VLARGSENEFFRRRLTPDANTSEDCRAELYARNVSCHLSCRTCQAECTDSFVESTVDAYRCSLGLPTLGLVGAMHTTDVGQDVLSRWGADRREGRPSIPESVWQEQYHTMVQNSIDAPVAPRNSVSCRRPHRESSVGQYVPALKEDGKPIQRQGFMVECDTDADCFSRCPVSQNCIRTRTFAPFS
tara:strand:- start:7075 stop:7632 length:558 start_codon:yes stop_codon:yes gene_type:complete